MPTYLLHGFRWPRPLIRIHIILQNLDDCAAEWLLAPLTSSSLLQNFHTLYPAPMTHLPSLRFIEQYNPDDEISTEQPYAYVCDQVHEVNLSVDVDHVRGRGVKNEAWSALADLRDAIAPGEKVGWFVVVCGDVERWAPGLGESSNEEDVDFPGERRGSSARAPRTSAGVRVRESSEEGTRKSDGGEVKGLRKWLSRRARRARSSKDLRNPPASPSRPQHSIPTPIQTPTQTQFQRRGSAPNPHVPIPKSPTTTTPNFPSPPKAPKAPKPPLPTSPVRTNHTSPPSAPPSAPLPTTPLQPRKTSVSIPAHIISAANQNSTAGLPLVVGNANGKAAVQAKGTAI